MIRHLDFTSARSAVNRLRTSNKTWVTDGVYVTEIEDTTGTSHLDGHCPLMSFERQQHVWSRPTRRVTKVQTFLISTNRPCRRCTSPWLSQHVRPAIDLASALSEIDAILPRLEASPSLKLYRDLADRVRLASELARHLVQSANVVERAFGELVLVLEKMAKVSSTAGHFLPELTALLDHPHPDSSDPLVVFRPPGVTPQAAFPGLCASVLNPALPGGLSAILAVLPSSVAKAWALEDPLLHILGLPPFDSSNGNVAGFLALLSSFVPPSGMFESPDDAFKAAVALSRQETPAPTKVPSRI